MEYVTLKTEYIKLGQLLKYLGVISNGSEEKIFLENNDVFVNDEIEKRRGRKVYPDYIVKIDNRIITIK